jgi:hypothetical protein
MMFDGRLTRAPAPCSVALSVNAPLRPVQAEAGAVGFRRQLPVRRTGTALMARRRRSSRRSARRTTSMVPALLPARSHRPRLRPSPRRSGNGPRPRRDRHRRGQPSSARPAMPPTPALMERRARAPSHGLRGDAAADGDVTARAECVAKAIVPAPARRSPPPSCHSGTGAPSSFGRACRRRSSAITAVALESQRRARGTAHSSPAAPGVVADQHVGQAEGPGVHRPRGREALVPVSRSGPANPAPRSPAPA